jgi:hypothetical protein
LSRCFVSFFLFFYTVCFLHFSWGCTTADTLGPIYTHIWWNVTQVTEIGVAKELWKLLEFWTGNLFERPRKRIRGFIPSSSSGIQIREAYLLYSYDPAGVSTEYGHKVESSCSELQI